MTTATDHPYPYAATMTPERVLAAAEYLRDGGEAFTHEAFYREVLTAIAISKVTGLEALLAALYALRTDGA